MRSFLSLFTVVVLCIATSVSQAELVTYWSFDADFTADAGGSAFDLSPENGATAGDAGGKFGNAATFERANSEYAFTSGNVLQPNTDFSYSAWYNLAIEDIVGGNRYFVLETSAADSPVGTEAWTASIGARDIGGTDSIQIFTSPSQQVGQTELATNTWQNIIVTYNSTSGDITGYLNGSEFVSSTQASTTAVEGLVIGGHRAGTGRNFEGQIDAVSFYDHVLSAAEISSLQSQAFVPEPSSVSLLLLGAAVLLRATRRSK